MNALRDTISCVLDVDRKGSQLIQRDEHTLILAKHDYISQHLLDLIIEQHPAVEVSTQRNRNGDGFIVVFYLCQHMPLAMSSHFVQVMLLAVTLVMSAVHAFQVSMQ